MPRGRRFAMIVCFVANPSIDKLFEVERLVPGGIHRPAVFVQTAGGKGLNVARAAHTLGADVRAAGILGGHAGKWLEEALEGEAIRGSFVWTDGETRSSLSVAGRERADLTEFYERGSAVSVAVWASSLEAVGGLFEPGRWLTISGSLPPGAPEDGYHALVERARAARMRVALDTHGEYLRRTLPAGPDIVKVNATEAGELLGVPTASSDDSMAAGARIRDLAGGMGHAGVVTRGSEGAVVAAPDGTRYEGVLSERGRYPVGSGDAFLAGLVVALERSWDWPSALRLALGAAGANAQIPGAGRLDPARAEELADRAEVREL
ncbi:MAG: 1-phosphofructokinase family hexose kinase [Actinomycetota bacterium]